MRIGVALIWFIFKMFGTILFTNVVTEFSGVFMLFSVDLLGLLNWRSNPEDLDQILQRLMEIEGGEIVKVSSAPLNM